jgi:2-oxoisovalerate dehydrogenase E2 component (dihydrolipoyl transacylase)
MVDVKMPQLGESVTEGTLSKWLKGVGDRVTQYEPIAEVVTDKVTAEIPSDVDGVIQEILVPEGQTVSVGTVLCRIQAAAGDPDSASPSAGTATDAEVSHAASAVDSERQTSPAGPKTGAVNGGRGRFSPAVLRLAEEHGVDLSQVQGTGEGGRITRKDVLAYIEARRRMPAEDASMTASAPGGDATASRPGAAVPEVSTPGQDVTITAGAPSMHAEDIQVIEPSPIRRTIARRMVEAKHTAPHAWTMVEVDVTRLVALRERLKTEFRRKEGVDLTYLPFFIKAVVEGLKQYPMLNASWVDDKIHVHRRIHISIAVATDDALVVPVIHDADRLSIAGLAHAVHDLATRARAGRLSMADVQGGTFTVNNTGAFGSILSQPILNMPQAAILSVESIVKRPVVVNDAIAIRSMVNLCLSLDHRVLDGWVAGQFLRAVKQRLESFDENTVIY